MKHNPEEYHQYDHFKFETSSNIMFRELEDESVILNLNDESYYSLNSTGMIIWNLLQTSPSLKEAFEAFKNQFEVESGKASTDFHLLIHELVEKQFGTLAKAQTP